MLEPSLLSLIDTVSQRAIETGALMPIDTVTYYVHDSGIDFVVRVLANLVRKDKDRHKRAQDKAKNPFLPYEKALYVADIADSHVAILNKFNVIDRHLLVVTREFEPQEELLTLKDFNALWQCMSQYHSLGFYNAGEAAGASQPHKHLQIVPLPLTEKGFDTPFDPLFAEVKQTDKICKLSKFQFQHCFVKLKIKGHGNITEYVHMCFDKYVEMLDTLGMSVPQSNTPTKQSCAYCLLVTKQWMLLVPRSKEFYDGISINSLGFAGCLLVRQPQHIELIKQVGAFKILQSVAVIC